MKYRLPPFCSSATPLGHTEFVVGEDGWIEVPDGTPPEIIQALVSHCGAVALPDSEQTAVPIWPLLWIPALPASPAEPPATDSSPPAPESPPMNDSEEQTKLTSLTDDKTALLAQLSDLGVKIDKRASLATLREILATAQSDASAG